MDIGYVNGFYFANNSAIGLEPYITLTQQRITWIKGMVALPGGGGARHLGQSALDRQNRMGGGHYEGPALLVSVGNGAADGRRIFHGAACRPFDGKLTFVHGYRRRARARSSDCYPDDETRRRKFSWRWRVFMNNLPRG